MVKTMRWHFAKTRKLVPRARDPLGQETKGIIHLFPPQILEIRYYCACARYFKMEDMLTEISELYIRLE